jgi:O-antigen ligase/tetratricopeptide (TPR) repeat protein
VVQTKLLKRSKIILQSLSIETMDTLLTTEKNTKGMVIFLLSVIRYSLMAALFTPLVFHPDFVYMFVVPKTAFFWFFVEIALAAWVLLLFFQPKYRPSRNVLTMSVLAFLGITILSSLFGVNIEQSFWGSFARMTGVISLIHLIGFFVVCSSVFRDKESWSKMFKISFFVGIIVCILYFLQRWGFAFGELETFGGSTAGNSSYLSGYLLFNLYIGIWLFIQGSKFIQKSLIGLGVSLITVTILASGANGAIVSFFGGLFLLIVCWIYFGTSLRYRKLFSTVLLIAGIVIGSLGSVAILSGHDIAQPILTKMNPGTISSRLIVWKSSWQGVMERPLLGWGSENFEIVFAKYFNPELRLLKNGRHLWFDKSHNIIFDTLVTVGFLGLISYLLIFFAALKLLWDRVKKADKLDGDQSRNSWIFSAIMMVALVSYFAQNLLFFDTIVTQLMFFLILACICGINPSKAQGEMSTKSFSTRSRITMSVFIYVLLLLSIFTFVIQPLRSSYFGFVVYNSGSNIQSSLNQYRKMTEITPIKGNRMLEVIVGRITRMLSNGVGLNPEIIENVEDIGNAYLQDNPNDLRYILNMAKFYTAAGGYDPMHFASSERLLRKAISLSPDNQKVYIYLSELFLSQGDQERAFAFLNMAIDLEPGVGEPQLQMVELFVEMGEYESARVQLDKVLNIEYELVDIFLWSHTLFESDENGEADVNADNVHQILVLSENARNNGDLEGSIKLYKEAIKLKMEDSLARFFLAKFYMMIDESDKAKIELIETVRLNPGLKKAVQDFLEDYDDQKF